MKKHYRVVLSFDADGYWVAEHPDLPGCKADGETEIEAIESLNEVRDLWIESRMAAGLEVPAPQQEPEYSGRFVLRVPRSMHRELVQEANAEDVSLNVYINHVLASRHTQLHVPEHWINWSADLQPWSSNPVFRPKTELQRPNNPQFAPVAAEQASVYPQGSRPTSSRNAPIPQMFAQSGVC